MPQSRKTPSRKEPGNPDLFFEKELAGEKGLTRSTAARLYVLAMGFDARAPWDILEDQDLILFEEPDSNHLCFCSVMGALGEIFCMNAFIGLDAYGLFKKLAIGKPMTVGEFYAAGRGVSVELVPSGELTPPDRGLLRALGHPFRRGAACPVFRTGRAGYLPWYITESEGQILAACLEAVNAFCDELESHPGADYWDKEDKYPLVSMVGTEADGKKCQVRVLDVPGPFISMPEPAAYDESRAARILRQNLPRHGVWELDHFFSGTVVGRRQERKACVRVAIAVEVESGYAFPPVLGTPLNATGDLLVMALFDAIETIRFMPHAIRVKDAGFAVSLALLAQALGVEVDVAASLPALECFKKQLMQVMGDPGTIPR